MAHIEDFIETRGERWAGLSGTCDNCAKNHKQAMLPLAVDVVAALRKWRPADVEPTALVFPRFVPKMDRFRKDLEAAKIPYVDAKGEFADFHSLRKTFGTTLTLAGVPERVVMELMRHSDMRLTAKTYTDAGMLPIDDAVALLPSVSGDERAHP